jgi:hypothetical protein
MLEPGGCAMSDDRPKLSRSTRQLLDDGTRNTPGRMEDSARPLISQGELERLSAEWDVRRGLHRPDVTIRRID